VKKTKGNMIKKILFLTQILFSTSVLAVDRIEVVASIYPQKHFIEKIGGDLVDVTVMVKPGASPHSYEPTPKQMVGLSKAKIFFSMGVFFETIWLDKFVSVNRNLMVVKTDKGIEKIPIGLHDHGKSDGKHGFGLNGNYIPDPHVWLSPPLVRIVIKNIFEALVDIDPDNKSKYNTNYKKFDKEILELDREIKSILEGGTKKFMVFHPSFGYFAKSYGLTQIPVEIEGKEPKPRDLNRLINHALENKIKVIFVQPQFSSKSANTIADAIGGKVVYVDPLAYNWSENIIKIAKKFRSVE